MATSSIIGKVLDDTGKCKVIYCHNDGYIEKSGVGWTLQKYYQNEKDVDKLLELGDLSFLGEIPEDDPELWLNIDHSNKCRTYKGRGDTGVDAAIFKSPRIARSEIGEVYNYFYLDGKWYCLKDDEIIDLETGKNVKQNEKVECLKSLKEEFYPELKIGDKVTIQGLGEDSPWEGLNGEVTWIDEEAFGDEFQTIQVRVEFPTADGYREVDQNFDRKNIKKIVEETLEEKHKSKKKQPNEESTYTNQLKPVPENFEITELSTFKKDIKRLGLTDADIEDLKKEIKERAPEANLGSNVYKFRFSPASWSTGSRDGSRVIYINIIKSFKVYLVTMYRKSEKENLTSQELKYIRDYSKSIE